MDTSYPRANRRHAAFALTGDRGAILVARDHTREFLGEIRPPMSPTTTIDALMLVSELVTNAVRHAPGPCTLYLVHDTPPGPGDPGSPALTIAVSDTSTTAPSPRTPDTLEGSGGLGWHMIQRLTTIVRIHFVPSRGKTIETTLAILPS